MSDQLLMFDLTICGPIVDRNVISLLGLGDGALRSGLPDGLTTDLFGREAVLVSRSAERGRGRRPMTGVICGLNGSDSSTPVDPASSSENKWRQQRSSASREQKRLYAMENRKKNRSYELVRHARDRARKKGLAFDLDGYLTEIQRRIDNGLCEVTGLSLNLEGGRTWDSPSLDRINPKGPYLYSNIRIVCHAINSAMGDWGEQKVVQLALAILAVRKRKSADLSKRLHENLARQLNGRGSTLFNLIWRERVTPSGRPYFQLVASALRTSGTDFGSWPTTTKEDGRSSARHGYMITGNQGTTLTDAARMASWPTPDASVGNLTDTTWQDRRALAAARHGNNGFGLTLGQAGMLVTGSPAPTEKRGQLNPALSRWLQGFPEEWDVAAIEAGRSIQTVRRKVE